MTERREGPEDAPRARLVDAIPMYGLRRGWHPHRSVRLARAAKADDPPSEKPRHDGSADDIDPLPHALSA
jgi:hypothetical protein